MKLGKKLLIAMMGISVSAVAIVSMAALFQFVRTKDSIVETKEEEKDELYETNIGIMTEATKESVRVFAVGYGESISSNIENIQDSVELAALQISDLYRKESEGISRFEDSMIYLQPGVAMDEVAEEFARIKEARDVLDNMALTVSKASTTYYVSESGMLLSNIEVDYTQANGQDIDRRTREWYTGAVEAKGVYWTDVYQDALSGSQALTCACPVYGPDGALMGVVAQDIYLESICEAIFTNSSDLFEYSFITDETGQFIVGAGKGEGQEISAKVREISGEAREMAKAGEDTVGIYPDKKAVLGYSKIQGNHWNFYVLLDYDTIAAPANHVGQAIMESNDMFLGVLDQNIRGVFCAFSIVALCTVAVVLAATSQITRSIVRPVEMLTEGVQKISKGNLDYELTVQADGEIGQLADAFRKMTVDLREYIQNLARITAEKERISAELDVATNIQKSMLPCIFPAFPDRKEIEIYATMNPAKEVGGDFYDFFMVDEKHLAIVMADVSGKGVPAALFMVIGKTLIKDHTQLGKDLGEVFTEVNDLLCESNSEGLFITAFEGVLDLATGEFRFVNAGHEPPFICRKGGVYEPYKVRAGFVLAGMEGMKYKSGSIQLSPGDKIFQYTDGVTEASNRENELYGMERLKEVLCKNAASSPDELLPAIKDDIDRFVGDAPQFDDITMLCLEYKAQMVG